MRGANGELGRGSLDPDLRGRSVRGGVATMVAQGIKFVVTLGSIAILGRLLRPEDFGLVAMVLALTGFLSRFKDFGLAISSVQRTDITSRQLTGLFWVNTLIGALLAGVVLLSGPALAWLYAEPRLSFVAVAMATTFLISGLGVQHAAVLRRRLCFSSIASIEILAVFLSAAVGVASALAGAGYWALVAMQIVNASILSIGAWWACDWRPGPPEREADIRSLVAFGGRLSLVSLMNSVARSVDGFLIGWRWGATPLGLYSKAIQLSLIVVEQLNVSVTKVAIPVLSSLQGHPDQFRGYYRRGVQLIASISIPIVVTFFVFAEEIIRFVLGAQWDEAAILFRCLAPAALFESLRVVTSWVYISLGNTQQQLRWAMISAAVRMGCIVVGVYWGAQGVAIGYSVGVCGLWVPGVIYCFRSSPLQIADLTRVLWRPMAAALVAGGVSWWVFTFTSVAREGVALRLIAELGLFGGSYLLASLLLPGGWVAARDLLTLGRELKRGGDRT